MEYFLSVFIVATTWPIRKVNRFDF